METAVVLEAALLGNRYNISRDAAERFRAGGTFHVLVISGLHIAFIGGLVIFVTRGLTKRKILQFVIAARLERSQVQRLFRFAFAVVEV